MKATRTETDFLPAALEIQERPPSPAGRAILWSIMVFFCIAVVWALLGEIDIVASAQGKIVPSGRVKVIQPVDIGVVRTIHIQEGQRVEAGDVLIELDPTATRADVERLHAELLTAQIDAVRYRELHRAASIDNAIDTTVPSLAGSMNTDFRSRLSPETLVMQQQRLASEWREYQARVAALSSGIASREAELAATRADVSKRAGTLPLITRRVNSLEPLREKKLIAEHEWLKLEEQRIEQKQELASLKSRARQVEASISETQQQQAAVKSEFRGSVLTRLAETEQQINQLEQEYIKAKQRSSLQLLRAPVPGVVQQLAVHTVGGVVTPAQELMRIVPQDQALEVEAWVQNKDVGFVTEGQQAEIKVETFPFTRYGVIEAEVIDVSNDAVSNEEQGLVYAARVLMKATTMQVGERLVNLSSGMAVTVEVKTGTRRLIEFVLSPLLRYRDESLGER